MLEKLWCFLLATNAHGQIQTKLQGTYLLPMMRQKKPSLFNSAVPVVKFAVHEK